MNFRLGILVIFIISNFTPVLLVDLGPKTLDTYGPYEIVVAHYEVCKGSKLKNSAIFLASIEKNEKGDYIFQSNITFVETTELNEIRIKAMTVKNNKKSTLLNYKVSQPCDHFAIAALIEKHLNAKNCVTKKGSYSLSMNYSEVSKKFFGSAFFYGEYEMKSVVTSKKGNIACIIIKLVFKKIDKKL